MTDALAALIRLLGEANPLNRCLPGGKVTPLREGWPLDFQAVLRAAQNEITDGRPENLERFDVLDRANKLVRKLVSTDWGKHGWIFRKSEWEAEYLILEKSLEDLPEVGKRASPFRKLLRFARKTCERELARYKGLAGMREDPAVLSAGVAELKNELDKLLRDCLAGAEAVGLHDDEARDGLNKRLTAFSDPIRAVLDWQQNVPAKTADGSDPAFEYMFNLIESAWSAWRPIEALAVRAESPWRTPTAREREILDAFHQSPAGQYINESISAASAAGYWFKKLEGKDFGADFTNLDQYLAAQHRLSRREIDKLTMQEIAAILKADFERKSAQIGTADDKTLDVRLSQLTENERAIIGIIEKLPRGKGIPAKGIVAELKRLGIELDEKTLRRWQIQRVKKIMGVKNSKARGGYYLPD